MKRLIKKSNIEFNRDDFDFQQLREIDDAIEKGLNIEKYLNPEIDSNQMVFIFEGLRKGYDVSLYDDWNKYNWYQMSEIVEGLEHDIDVSHYLDENLDSGQMRSIRIALQYDYPHIEYLKNPNLGEDKAQILLEGLDHEVDISSFANDDFDIEQMEIIIRALREELPFERFINPNISEGTLHRIYNTLDTLPNEILEKVKQLRSGFSSDWEVEDYIDELQKMKQIVRSDYDHDVGNRTSAIVYFNGKFYTGRTHAICINLALQDEERDVMRKDWYRPNESDIEESTSEEDVMFCGHLVEDPEETDYHDGTSNYQAIYLINESYLLKGVTIEEAAQIIKNSDEYGDYDVFDDGESYIDYDLMERIYPRLAKLKQRKELIRLLYG